MAKHMWDSQMHNWSGRCKNHQKLPFHAYQTGNKLKTEYFQKSMRMETMEMIVEM